VGEPVDTAPSALCVLKVISFANRASTALSSDSVVFSSALVWVWVTALTCSSNCDGFELVLLKRVVSSAASMVRGLQTEYSNSIGVL
jgi:hypothetical protein